MLRKRSVGAHLGALLLLSLTACDRGFQAGPPLGGEQLLPAAENASRVVVGRIGEREKIDLHGYAASLDVERELPSDGERPLRIRIAWEELAKQRVPRFAEGDRVLVALTSLPNASLWDERFPGARAGDSVMAVAAAGQAYMHNPDGVSVELLRNYLRLSSAARADRAGVEMLGRMVASAPPGLARSALARLESIEELNELEASALRPIIDAAADPHRPLALRRSVLELIGRRKLTLLRPRLDALAAPGSQVRAPALSAIAAIDGGLSEAVVADLLNSGDADLRAIGALHAGSALGSRLADLIRDDPAPAVRAAATQALVGARGLDSFDAVVPALADDSSVVRLAAVEAIGNLGPASVAPLTALVESGSLAEATGAVLALDRAGAAGKAALIQIAADHPDERVRNVALLALGKLGGHEH